MQVDDVTGEMAALDDDLQYQLMRGTDGGVQKHGDDVIRGVAAEIVACWGGLEDFAVEDVSMEAIDQETCDVDGGILRQHDRVGNIDAVHGSDVTELAVKEEVTSNAGN